ncbi:B12-binding domain-containing radical SAM protein [Bacteroidota bacterium]
MHILLIYPEIPHTFWSFKYALKFVSKKSSHPPLGLVTIAAMLPEWWEKKLVDLNVSSLKNEDLEWADYVFLSAMTIQRNSAMEIIDRCKSINSTIVAGGPLFTEEPENFPDVDHLILNEAEITLPSFISDLGKGKAKNIYQTEEFPDLNDVVVPMYSLLNHKKYATMSIQLTRGCPYNCDFCEITVLFGQKVRYKSSDQIIMELDQLYECNWKNEVFFVDDNFIGNRRFLKTDLLPKLTRWMEDRNYPFHFTTEVSINLADDETLLNMMVKAGFRTVFVGIETPSEESLLECGKNQNNNRNLVESIHYIQKRGLLVMGGFIVGFDSDTPSIFSRQIEFIKTSGIITAMVGLLNAPKKTRLWERLHRENRLTSDNMSGNNTDFTINFIPKMNIDDLQAGYRRILEAIYSTKPYYRRVKGSILRYQKNVHLKSRISWTDLKALIRSMFVLGMFNKGRRAYWRLVIWTLLRKPRAFSLAVRYAIFGYHFRKIYGIR